MVWPALRTGRKVPGWFPGGNSSGGAGLGLGTTLPSRLTVFVVGVMLVVPPLENPNTAVKVPLPLSATPSDQTQRPLPVPPQVVLDWQAMGAGETRSMKALTTPL